MSLSTYLKLYMFFHVWWGKVRSAYRMCITYNMMYVYICIYKYLYICVCACVCLCERKKDFVSTWIKALISWAHETLKAVASCAGVCSRVGRFIVGGVVVGWFAQQILAMDQWIRPYFEMKPAPLNRWCSFTSQSLCSSQVVCAWAPVHQRSCLIVMIFLIQKHRLRRTRAAVAATVQSRLWMLVDRSC